MLRTRVDLPLPMPPSTTTLCSRIALAPAQVPPQAGEQAVVGAGSTCRQRYRRRCLQLRIAAQVGGMDEVAHGSGWQLEQHRALVPRARALEQDRESVV